MARIANFFDGNFQSCLGSGLANNGGYAKFYTAGVTSPTTADYKNTYPTYDDAVAGTNANANPLVFNSAGRPTTGCWLSGAYKIYVYDANNVLLWSQDDINADPLQNQSTIADSLIKNGSFENWSSATSPDNMTPVAAGLATFAKDAADSYHGGSSFKVVGSGTDGVTTTWDDYFEVSEGQELLCEFMMKCALASTNIVRILWFTNSTGTAAATPSTDIYNAAAAVTSWTRKYGFATPPTGAKYGKLRTILSSGGTADTVRIDGISVRPSERNVNTFAIGGTLAVTGASEFTAATTHKAGVQVGKAAVDFDKLITFYPTSGAAVNMRIVGWAKGDTSGTAGSVGGICNGLTSNGLNIQTISLLRAPGSNFNIQVTSNHAGANGRIVNAWYNTGSPGDIKVQAYDAADVAQSCVYSLVVWEFT